jgi:hypothetical protein
MESFRVGEAGKDNSNHDRRMRKPHENPFVTPRNVCGACFRGNALLPRRRISPESIWRNCFYMTEQFILIK